MPSHSISNTGLALIQEFEGFRAEPTQLPDGNWVVGHGHVHIGEAGANLTEAEAADLLALDLAPTERAVNSAVTSEIGQNQFDALVSFAFSVGVDAFQSSAVLRRVNAGDFTQAACAMDAWRKSDVSGELEIIDALVRRRAAEKALFLKGQKSEVSPSVFMRAKLDHAASILGAPVAYAAAPAVGSIPVAQPKPEATERLAEILMSEPATEALLLTRVATEEEIAADGEITTAHAKPIARKLDRVTPKKRAPGKLSFRFSRPTETIGLIALSVFGAALMALGASTLLGGSGDVINIMGAGSLTAPGLAAVLMAGFGLWRGPMMKAA